MANFRSKVPPHLIDFEFSHEDAENFSAHNFVKLEVEIQRSMVIERGGKKKKRKNGGEF